MILNLLFQIIISWLFACCILKLFHKAVSASYTEVYRKPTLLTTLLATAHLNLSRKGELIAGTILHHCTGLCFAAIYYLIWHNEFTEISWTISLIIGFITSLIRIISWTFLLEIIPASNLINFKGYYLQLVFVHNIFIIAALTIFKLFF